MSDEDVPAPPGDVEPDDWDDAEGTDDLGEPTGPDRGYVTGVQDLLGFLDASPSPWHAVDSAIHRLTMAGFAPLALTDPWTELPHAGFVARGGALVAFRVGTSPAGSVAPFRIVGAHTDSPCLRIKPRPDTGGFVWKQLAVEVYGGILSNSWLDRDLGIAGRCLLYTSPSPRDS